MMGANGDRSLRLQGARAGAGTLSHASPSDRHRFHDYGALTLDISAEDLLKAFREFEPKSFLERAAQSTDRLRPSLNPQMFRAA
jgi:hypothetical protein